MRWDVALQAGAAAAALVVDFWLASAVFCGFVVLLAAAQLGLPGFWLVFVPQLGGWPAAEWDPACVWRVVFCLLAHAGLDVPAVFALQDPV